MLAYNKIGCWLFTMLIMCGDAYDVYNAVAVYLNISTTSNYLGINSQHLYVMLTAIHSYTVATCIYL